jgi:hypothetical protein
MHRDSAVPVLTGCAAQVPTAIFGASCEARACHNSVDHIYGLDLQSPGLVSRLINTPSYELPVLMMIDPNVPDNSFLLVKVKPNPPAGVQMPQMGNKLRHRRRSASSNGSKPSPRGLIERVSSRLPVNSQSRLGATPTDLSLGGLAALLSIERTSGSVASPGAPDALPSAIN